MMRQVHPDLYVGDGEAPNADLKAWAGYVPGDQRVVCDEWQLG